jgi:gliding motility-associated-like protein
MNIFAMTPHFFCAEYLFCVTMIKTNTYLHFFCLFLLYCSALSGQTPFQRTGQVFQILSNTNELAVFNVTPGSNVLDVAAVSNLQDAFNALGYRKQDNFLYAIHQSDNHLFRIGDNGTMLDLGVAGLDNMLFYLAGDITIDGKYLVCIGSNANNEDVQLAKIDLTSSPLTTELISMSGAGRIQDIAFDLYTSILYGFDGASRKIVTIDVNSGAVNTSFAPINYENQIFTLYFDPFGDLYATGRAVNGIVDGLFLMDKSTGKETRLATGPTEYVADGASCPFAVAIKYAAEPEIVLPCGDITFKYSIANGSGEPLNSVDFEHVLPPGFHLANVIQNPYSVPFDTLSVTGAIRFNTINLSQGIKNMSIKIRVDDIAKGNYQSQARIIQLPALYGTTARSDNPATGGFRDSSVVKVNRFEEDTISYQWLVCTGQTKQLDAREYGGSILWMTGSTNPLLTVSTGGLYSLAAGNTCEFVVVNHEVTFATCPFTIELDHKIVPSDTFFPCSDVTFRYILRNDSGEDRKNTIFTDTMPAGFSLVEIQSNPFGGNIDPGSASNIITIKNLLLKKGVDTMDILVNAGEMPPGDYKNRAYIRNIPLLMGPFRVSDNPNTSDFDSTSMHLLGTGFDSLWLDKKICLNIPVILDATTLGKTFLWEDGSSGATLEINSPGDYHLVLLDGCEPADVFWHVADVGRVEVPELDTFYLHQGEQMEIKPVVYSQGDTLIYTWIDPAGNSLSCFDCPDALVMPFKNTIYTFLASNGACKDSVFIIVQVDETRRIYTGNVFSPDDDGVNDFFFLQSPDAAIIRSFSVADRWGNLVFEDRKSGFNEQYHGWNGDFKGRPAPAGVYFWWAVIEFPDGEIKVVKGDVTLIR